MTEGLTTKRFKMLEKARELTGFVNVWSQNGKIMFFDKNINKVNVFYNWNLGDVTDQLWEEKTLLVCNIFVEGFFISFGDIWYFKIFQLSKSW